MGALKDMISDHGQVSSKRVAGLIGLTVMHGLVVWMCGKQGMTNNLEHLCMALAILDGSLLGITALEKVIGKL